MSDPWGEAQPPAIAGAVPPLPPRLARLAEIQAGGVAVRGGDPYAQSFPRADELPEVQALIAEGWRPLHPAPLYCLLPAAWPAEHRAWVPDRLPRVGMGGTTGSYFGTIVPWESEDVDWELEELTERAREAGLPQPPAGRIWLLRSPWSRIPVAAIYRLVWSHAQRRPGDPTLQVFEAARAVLAWDEHRALEACPRDLRRLLDAWGAADRVGETVARMVDRELLPDQLAVAIETTRLDENTLLDWLDSLGADPDNDVIAFINAWRAMDLPGDPPPGAHRYLGRDPGELRAWLDAGFDIHAAHELHLAGLDTALRWRAAGFSEADTYELLRSDPALTPAEARAFDAAGPARERRRQWIYHGFTAQEAAAWAAAGLRPAEARLWRACGKQPADVGAGQRIPPELIPNEGYLGFGRIVDGVPHSPEWDALPDPAGTRGRYARRMARDDDPWINTD